MTQKWSYRWFVLALATAAQIGGSFLVQALGALSPFLQSAFALDAAELGFVMTAAQIALIPGLLAAGLLLDRLGERRIVALGAVFVSAAIFAAARAGSYEALLGWLLLGSLGYCTIQPAGGKVVAAWFGPDTRGVAMGIRQAGLPLGAALGALVLPGIAERDGWRAAFDAGALAALAGGLAFALLYVPPPDAAMTQAQPAFAHWRARLAEVAPRLPAIAWPGVTLVSVQFCITMYLPLDLRDRFDLPVETGVKLLFSAQFAGAVGRILLAAWGDRSARGRGFPLGVSMAAVALGVAAYVVAPGAPLWLVTSVAVWLGFFGFGWYGPWIAMVAEAAPRGRIGFMIGLAMAINQIFVAATPPAFGALRDMTGSYAYGWGLAGLAVVAALAQISARSCANEPPARPRLLN